jgi:carbonic anhydrase
MGLLRNRRVFGRALVSTLAFAVSVGLLALWETGRGTVLSAGTDTSAPEFAYSGDNEPGFWGETPGWEACAGTARTQRQSPIDIDHIIFDRHLGPLQLRLHETPLALTNNAHTIEEEYERGSSLTVNGVVYGLTQFHFHTLSEHTVTDRHAAMELHACSRTLPPTTRRSSASCSSSARPIAAEAKRAHGSQHRG